MQRSYVARRDEQAGPIDDDLVDRPHPGGDDRQAARRLARNDQLARMGGSLSQTPSGEKLSGTHCTVRSSRLAAMVRSVSRNVTWRAVYSHTMLTLIGDPVFIAIWCSQLGRLRSGHCKHIYAPGTHQGLRFRHSPRATVLQLRCRMPASAEWARSGGSGTRGSLARLAHVAEVSSKLEGRCDSIPLRDIPSRLALKSL